MLLIRMAFSVHLFMSVFVCVTVCRVHLEVLDRGGHQDLTELLDQLVTKEPREWLEWR